MARYSDLVELKGTGTPYDLLEPISHERAKMVAARYALASDYIDFLVQVGWGELGHSAYMLYEGPIEASDVYRERPSFPDLVLIGDDFAGYCAGVLPARSAIVEIDPTTNKLIPAADSFEDFIRTKIAELGERKP